MPEQVSIALAEITTALRESLLAVARRSLGPAACKALDLLDRDCTAQVPNTG